MTNNDFCSILTSDNYDLKNILTEIAIGDVSIDFIDSLAAELFGNASKAIRKYEVSTRAQSFEEKIKDPENGNPFASLMDVRTIAIGSDTSIKAKEIIKPPSINELFPQVESKLCLASKEIKERVKLISGVSSEINIPRSTKR